MEIDKISSEYTDFEHRDKISSEYTDFEHRDKTGSGYTDFEYMKKTVSDTNLPLYLDGYENFGWCLDERFPDLKSEGNVTLHLKRNRKIMNKMELTRLQRNFEACMEEVDMMEKEKTSMPTVAAIVVGIIGTALLAGSVFAVTATPPVIWLCILLGTPGLIGWVLPYFLFRRLTAKKQKEMEPLIGQKQEEIYALLEKGHSLL